MIPKPNKIREVIRYAVYFYLSLPLNIQSWEMMLGESSADLVLALKLGLFHRAVLCQKVDHDVSSQTIFASHRWRTSWTPPCRVCYDPTVSALPEVMWEFIDACSMCRSTVMHVWHTAGWAHLPLAISCHCPCQSISAINIMQAVLQLPPLLVTPTDRGWDK